MPSVNNPQESGEQTGDNHSPAHSHSIFAAEGSGEAGTAQSFYQTWLAYLCQSVEGIVVGGLLLGKPDEGPYLAMAIWPDRKGDISHLREVVQQAINERKSVLVKRPPVADGDKGMSQGSAAIAYPVVVSGRARGAVVLEFNYDCEKSLERVPPQLYWGTGKLEKALAENDASAHLLRQKKLTLCLDLLATVNGQPKFEASARALVTELADYFHCDRVSVGFLDAHYMAVQAMSHSAHFGDRTNLVQAIGAAMDEACSQNTILLYPEPPAAVEDAKKSPLPGVDAVVRAHAELAGLDEQGCILTIPLIDQGAVTGALTLERSADQPFERHSIELCEAVAALLGPVLNLQRLNDQSMIRRARRSTRQFLEQFITPEHLVKKTLASVALLVLIALCLLGGDYRVTSNGALESTVLRSAVSPFSGYIGQSDKRAGDVVEEGELLAQLDGRDLQVEEQTWSSREAQLTRQFRQANAAGDRGLAQVLTAQIDQVQAELSGVRDRLARSSIRAPFAGVIVSGDLSQLLSAPVEKGQVLFEVAPLNSFRVILEIDEKYIRDIVPGQTGGVSLAGLPDQELAFTVDKITPVATSAEGANFYRVEGVLGNVPAGLLPGMEGVAKVHVGERKLIWIWTHRLSRWLSLWFWSWWP